MHLPFLEISQKCVFNVFFCLPYLWISQGCSLQCCHNCLPTFTNSTQRTNPLHFLTAEKAIFCRYSFLCFFTPHKVIGMEAVTVLLVKSNKYIKDQESCHAWLPPDVSITIITTISVYLTSQTPIIVNGLISLSFQFYNNLLIIPHSSAYPHHHTQDFNVISLYHI